MRQGFPCFLLGTVLVAGLWTGAGVGATHRESAVSYDYGSYVGCCVPGVGHVFTGSCQDNHPWPRSAGCDLTTPGWPAVTISVVDHAGAGVRFLWRGSHYDAEREAYQWCDDPHSISIDKSLEDTGDGTTTFTLPAGCTHVDVYPAVGSFGGTIAVR